LAQESGLTAKYYIASPASIRKVCQQQQGLSQEAEAALAKIGAGIPEPEAAAPRRPKTETGLPMPRRREEG